MIGSKESINRLQLTACAYLILAMPLYAAAQGVHSNKPEPATASKSVSTTKSVPTTTSDSVSDQVPALSKRHKAVVEPVSESESHRTAHVDFKALEQRLKQTDAIGFFTKLAIRNDILDLMDNIKRYRKQALLNVKMKEIRSRFDGLLLKIIALLDHDPELSRDLYVGRESIWESLLEVKA